MRSRYLCLCFVLSSAASLVLYTLADAPSKGDLDRAFRKLSRAHHPDKTGASDAPFVALQKAREQLGSSPEQCFFSNHPLCLEAAGRATRQFINATDAIQQIGARVCTLLNDSTQNSSIAYEDCTRSLGANPGTSLLACALLFCAIPMLMMLATSFMFQICADALSIAWLPVTLAGRAWAADREGEDTMADAAAGFHALGTANAIRELQLLANKSPPAQRAALLEHAIAIDTAAAERRTGAGAGTLMSWERVHFEWTIRLLAAAVMLLQEHSQDLPLILAALSLTAPGAIPVVAEVGLVHLLLRTAGVTLPDLLLSIAGVFMPNLLEAFAENQKLQESPLPLASELIVIWILRPRVLQPLLSWASHTACRFGHNYIHVVVIAVAGLASVRGSWSTCSVLIAITVAFVQQIRLATGHYEPLHQTAFLGSVLGAMSWTQLELEDSSSIPAAMLLSLLAAVCLHLFCYSKLMGLCHWWSVCVYTALVVHTVGLLLGFHSSYHLAYPLLCMPLLWSSELYTL